MTIELPNNIFLTIPNASGRFTPHIETIHQQTARAVELARVKLPLVDIDIIFLNNSAEAIPHLGFGGYTPDAHTVLISVDIDHMDLAANLQTHLVHTLLHEFHHAMRWRGPGYGDTLGEALVTEGLADQFDVEMTGAEPQAWATVLSPDELEKLFERAQPLFEKSYSHADWFFGSADEVLPKWGGYALGFYLVGRYLAAHPDARASALCAMPAGEILRCSQ